MVHNPRARALRGCLVVLALLCTGCSRAAAEIPTAQTSMPPASPAPQAQTQAPAVTATADDERCRLATRQTEGVESCLASRDADHDQVDDGQDRCPDTTPGVAVDTTGCAQEIPVTSGSH